LLKAPNVDDFRVLGSSGDTTPAYLDSKVKNSIEVDSNQLQLVGDNAAPGALMVYGTDGSGTKGWQTYAPGTILTNTVTLSNADVLTLNSVPVEIIPNPGANLAVDIIHAVAIIKGTGGVVVPYATNTKLNIKTDTATEEFFADLFILLSTVDRTNCMTQNPALSGITDTKIIPNKSVYATIDTGDPTAGDAGNTLTINVMYRIISI